MRAIVDAVVALFRRRELAVAANRRLARAVAADLAAAAVGAVGERIVDPADGIVAASADARAGVVRTALRVAAPTRRA